MTCPHGLCGLIFGPAPLRQGVVYALFGLDAGPVLDALDVEPVDVDGAVDVSALDEPAVLVGAEEDAGSSEVAAIGVAAAAGFRGVFLCPPHAKRPPLEAVVPDALPE